MISVNTKRNIKFDKPPQRIFSEEDIKKDPILQEMFSSRNKSVIFLPFYGEFGHFIMYYIRFVNYYKSPHKIVCCKPDEKIYFPCANEFMCNWKNPLEDRMKRGHSNDVSAAIEEKKKLSSQLKSKYPGFLLVDLQTELPWWAVDRLPITLSPKNSYKLKSDIVIAPRKREFAPERNYTQWQKIVDQLVAVGYTVSCVGSKVASYDLKRITHRSWDFPDMTNANMSLLKNTKLYLGTDTGVTHLAALFSTPMIIFKLPTLNDCTGIVKNVTKGYFELINDKVLKSPDSARIIAGKALTYLGEPNEWKDIWNRTS